MSDIFISYASEDRDRVQSLARALESEGWSVWWDRRIPVGRSFDEVIQEAMDAAQSVVVVWTASSVKSQWVKNEAREGLRRRVLFPVMLLEEIKIPLEFGHVQAARLIDWQSEESHSGFNQFVQDLARILGPPPGAAVQPPPVKQPPAQPPSKPKPKPAKPKPKPDRESPPESRNPEKPDGSRHESTPPTPSAQSQRYIFIGIDLLVAMGLAAYGIWSQSSSPNPPIVRSDEPPPKQSQVATPPPAPAHSEKPSTSTAQETPNVAPDTTEVRTASIKPRPIAGPAKNITGKDGAPMVLIPAGEFWQFRMGSPDGEGNEDEHPQHLVFLDAFYIDKFEVTVSRYAEFVPSTNRAKPEYWDQVDSSKHGKLPVVGVDWHDAEAYCRGPGSDYPRRRSGKRPLAERIGENTRGVMNHRHRGLLTLIKGTWRTLTTSALHQWTVMK